MAARLVGDRYLNLGKALAGADIVHFEELGFWLSGQAAGMKSRYGHRRLVWEKGHQDVIRAIAALHRGLVASPARPRLVILGRGPERTGCSVTPRSWASPGSSERGPAAGSRRETG